MTPLAGVTVLDLTSVVAGPLATQILAQQGARVIKIEPREGDRARMLGAVAAPGFSSAHVALNAGKDSVALDLSRPEAGEILRRLVREADIFIHNSRPGVMERMGLGLDALRALRPDLIVVHITGYGPDGPMSARRAYDPIIQAESGMALGCNTGEPRLAPQYLCDKSAGLYTAQAASAALYARERDGAGRLVEVSLLEAAVSFAWMDVHQGCAFPSGATPPPNVAGVYRPWKTKDGWIVVVMLSDKEFRGWAEALDEPSLLTDPRFADMASRFLNWDALRERCAPALARLTRGEATERLREAGVPCGVCNSTQEMIVSEQIAHDGFIETVAEPAGATALRPLPVARFDGARATAHPGAQPPGAQTRPVLAEIGLSDGAIDAAFASGAAFAPEAPKEPKEEDHALQDPAL